ncbi:MAG: hypothetical protein FWC70_11060 [Defluviitaleaceae bacterium]|nr:hypothetical protein [Defluviitaleaceae bacterium]
MNSTRNSIIAVSAIMFVIASLLFLIIPITPTFLIAYGFALLAIAMFCGGKLYLSASPGAYPWFASFPKTILRYLAVQAVLSAIFVLRENILPGAFSITWFVLLHIILLAFFAITLIMLHSGKEIIEKKDAEIKQKVSALRLMQADVDLILRNNPEHAECLNRVSEALKYSDPMISPALVAYDEQIQRKIIEMNDPASGNFSQICEKLLILIADRNNRVKLMK